MMLILILIFVALIIANAVIIFFSNRQIVIKTKEDRQLEGDEILNQIFYPTNKTT
jgi:hypothetical protein